MSEMISEPRGDMVLQGSVGRAELMRSDVLAKRALSHLRTLTLPKPGTLDLHIEELLKFLHHADSGVRREAAYAIASIGHLSEKALPALTWALQDGAADVRRSVAYAMEGIGPEAVPALIEALKHQDPSVRSAAADSLWFMGPQAKESVPALLTTLGGDAPDPRSSAIRALGGIGSCEAVPSLVAALSDEDSDIRANAGMALEEMDCAPTEPILSLAEMCSSEHARTRKYAAEALGKIGPEAREAIPALLLLLEEVEDDWEEDDWESAYSIRNSAAWALGKIGTHALPALLSALKNENEWTRLAAAKALEVMGAEACEAVAAQTEALQDAEMSVRCRVAGALWNLGVENQKILPTLLSATRNDCGENRCHAVRSLGKAGPTRVREAIPALVSALKDQNGSVKTEAIEALREIGPDAIPALTEALKSKSALVRRYVHKALGVMGHQAVPALVSALSDEDLFNRLLVLEILQLMGYKASEAIPTLIDAIKDESYSIRRRAADALAWLGSEAKVAIPSLVTALEDEDRTVRETAAAALTRMAPEAVPALMMCLQNPNPLTRVQCHCALAMIVGSSEGS
ncbi:MAG: HEAT repeat domain-containing protein [Armatimonadetes bacterium]|nr:HEAT repeat domain-containing protein [Armatimonadota bacterium]